MTTSRPFVASVLHEIGMLMLTILCLNGVGQGATVYWDLNGTAAGAGSGVPSGTWDGSSTLWNSASDGTGTTSAWASGDTAVFSAGTDALGVYAITVSGTQDIGGLAFEEGGIILNGGTLNWSAPGSIDVASGVTATINSDLIGSAAITRTGTGTLMLAGNNSGFSGTVSLNAGVTRLLTNSALGTNTITLGNTDAVLELADGVTLANNVTVSNTGNAKTIRAVTGSVILNSAITQSESTVGNFRLEANSGATLTVNSNIGGVGLRTGGSGTKILTGTNTYTGNTQILGGTTRFSSASNLGSTATTASILIGSSTTSATLLYEGSGDTIADALSWNGTTGGATLNSSGTGALVFSNVAAIVAGSGSKTVTLTGTNTDDNTIAGIIQNNSGTNLTNVSKTGAGTWVLTGANTFNNTTVNGNGGTLRVTGGGKIGSAALAVTAGTLDIAGTVDQTVTTLSMGGGAAGSSATIQLGAGLKLTLGGNVTYSATSNNLTATITGGSGALLDLGGVARTFTINNSTNAVTDLLIDTEVTLQNGSLVKAGAGTLQILSSLASLTGPVEIQAGALDANLGNLNLLLNGGVYESAGAFTRSLGTGADQVQWGAAGGGFAAKGGSLAVTLGSAPDPLVWGTTSLFVPTGGALMFGSTSADDVVTFAHNIDLNDTGSPLSRTISAVDNTGVITDKAVLSGVLSNSSGAGGITKTGNGILELAGTNTFTGDITVSAGTLQFSTVSNNGGGASNLGQGTDGLSLGGGILSFIGSSNQATDRAITLTAGSTFDASGTGGATIAYNGAITAGGGTITLDGTGEGFLNGGITQTGTTADLNKNGTGTWTLAGVNVIADNLVINAGTLIIGSADAFGAGSGDDLFIRAATLKLGINGALTNSMDDLNVSTETAGGGVLDVNGTTGSAPTDILMGTETLSGSIIDSVGTGSIGATGTLVFRNGTVSANLTGAAALTKNSSMEVILAGDNAAFTGSTTMVNGLLTLDYTTNNGEKLSDTAALISSGGGTITLNGNDSGATTETLGSFTLNAGSLHLNINHGTGQTATLNLGAVTRAAGGTVEFNLSSGSASVQTSSANGAGSILGGYATVNGSQFATVSGGVIQGLGSTVSNNLATWQVDGDLTDSTGYTGTVSDIIINSLRFGAAGATSAVTVASDSQLTISSGGILVTSGVGSGTASITGGVLAGGSNELVVHQNNSTSAFAIDSSITGSTTLTKSGLGTLQLGGTNTYTGQTTINEGTVLLSGGSAIGDSSLVAIKSTASSLLDLNNGSETIAGLSSFGALASDGFADGLVAIGTGSLTIRNSSGSTRIFQGMISGSGTLIKTGANQQSFFGSNAGFTGTVIINQGLLDLSEGSTVMNGATAFTLNGGELLTDQETSASVDHIGNGTTILLNNTGGTRGLWARNADQNAGRADTVGEITLGAGHNVIQADSNDGTASESQVMTLTAASLARINHATLQVRGQNLGGTANSRGQIIFTATPGGIVGGSGAAGTTTMPIIPYIIGESAAVADTSLTNNLGNSFVFNTGTANGLRPLDLATEYILDEAGYNALTGAVLNNVRFAANPAATLTGAATQINSLVLDSSAAVLTVDGPASALNIKSGAILATTTTAANGISLGGFTSLTTDAGNDFIIYVTNATNTFTLNSALTSATPLVKSGAGTLSLTNAGNAFADVYLNQGFVQVDDLDKLGTGALNFFGGGLRLDAGWSDDLFTKTINIDTGGGTLDVSLVTAGVTLTGGIGDSTVNASDTLHIFTRSSNAGTTGQLTIQGSSSYSGTIIFRNSGINGGVINGVVLNGGTNAAINGNVEIGNITNINDTFDVVVALGADEQIVDTASVTFRGASGENAYFKLSGFTETVAGISDTTREGVIENVENTEAGIATDGKLIVNSSSDYSYNAYLRNRGSGTNPTLLAFEKRGAGTQMLIGDRISYSGTTTISGGTLHLQGVTAWNSDIVNNSMLILDETVNRTHSKDITGTGSLVKTGSASVTFAGGLNLTYSGPTTVKAGTMTVGSPINGTTSLNVVNSGSTLALTGGISNASSITSLVVGHGATLSLLDGTGNKLDGLTNLQLGSSGGLMTTLNLNVGDSAAAGDNVTTDLLSVVTGGTLALFAGNQITLNLTDAGLNPGQTYNLISAVDGGLLSVLGSGDWLLGSTPGGFTSITLNKTNNLISITTGTLITGPSYWTGLTDNTWNGAASNWSTDKAGTTPASSIPGQGTDVVFVADSHAGGALVTTLEQNFKVNSLTFESSASTPSSITINPGAITTSRLEVAPQVATDGIKISAGGPAAVTVAAPLKLGADQTWNIADSGAVLTISGGLQGEADVLKTGPGKLVISAAADPTFNTGLTTDLTISAGILEITNAGALGSTASSNPASVILNGSSVFYYNGTAGTVAANLTLGGGTLSAGAGNQTYSGTVNVSAASFINMRDNNSATTSTTARNITLSGLMSGGGSLTVDSVDTLTAGNAESGTLTISNNANTWNGELVLQRGTVVFTSNPTTDVNAGHVGAVTFNTLGRVIYRNQNGETLNRTGALTFAAGAIGEFSVDNISAVLGTDYVINQSGVVTLGSGGTGATARFAIADVASLLNITGGVVLGGSSSISVDGGDADSLVIISSVISDGGSGYSLAINDDAGAWGVSNDIIRLTGLNTFSGDLTLAEGTLQFDTVTDAGGAASSLGQGNAITLGGTLSFIGDGAANSQSTNRAITLTANSTLNVSGTNNATMTYTGAVSAAALQVTLTGSATGAGFITGGITQTTTAPDLVVSSGTWTISGTPITVGDDLKVNGVGTVLNLNTTGVSAYVTGTSNFMYLGNGGTINLGADDVSSAALGLEGILPGFETAGDAATFNTNTFSITTPRLDVGQIAAGFEGNVIGSGTVIVTGTTAGAGLSLYRGSVSANLSGPGAFFKAGMGDVTLSGDNSGLTGTTRLDAGNLILDYTTSNTDKINAATALDMRGGTLTMNGSNSAATSQSAASFTLGSGGSSKIVVNRGSGQEAVLNLGAITRASGSQDGTLRFVLPTGTQSATNGITTSTLNTNGLLGPGGFATVEDGTGTWFATNATNLAGGNVVGLMSSAKNDVSTWLTADHITDETTGFTGTLVGISINSLRFDAASGSDLNLIGTGVLIIASGGILVTDNVGGSSSIVGGALASGATEIIITHDSAQVFEISSDIRINHAVTKTGAGTLLLSGNNVYTDETEIQEGTLQVSGGNAIGDFSLVNLADDRSATLQLLSDEAIGRLAGGSAADGLRDLATVDIGSHMLTINQTAASTYAGLIIGSGTIIKNGALLDWTLANISSGFSGALQINGGGVILSGVGQIDATSIEINKGGYLRFANSGTTRSGTRILNDTPITLNSADGGIAGSALPRGLYINTDQDTTLDETVGVVTLGSGASYASLEATSANDDSDIIMNNLLRTNSATLNVRGTNLGGSQGQRNEFRIGDAANQTAFIANAANLVGGGGAAASQNISIVPWAVGESITGALAVTNMGNSLVTYVSGSGFRPLTFTEYNTFGSQVLATDNIRESLTGTLALASGPARTVNALVLHNASIAAATHAVTGAGAGESLAVTSGVFLFTLNPAAVAGDYGIMLDGFDAGVTVGGTNEYIFQVVNPQSDASDKALTATIASALASAADITKSGRGTLIFTAVNTAGGGARTTTINEGILEIADLDNIGGNTGALVFAGGTLRLGTGLTDDISQRAIAFLQGGAVIDTNGIDLVLANSVGSGIGGLTKAGLGNLTLNAAATYSGATIIAGGTLTIGASNATGMGGDLTVTAGSILDLGTNGIMAGLVSTSGASPLITGGGTISASTGFFFNHTGDTTIDAILAGAGGLLKAQANILTLAGLSTYTGTTEIQAGTLSINSITNVGGGASALGNAANAENGIIRMGLTTAATTLQYTGTGHSSDRLIGMQGTTGSVTLDADGTGALVLTGGTRFEMAGSKTLILRGSSDAAIDNAIANVTENGGVLTLNKTDGNTWLVNGGNTYTGVTQIDNGTLKIGVADALPTGTTVRLGTGATAGTLDLNGFNQTIGSLLVQTNSTTETNNLIIDAGNTLTVNGAVTIGVNANASTTMLTASGGGSIVVNSGGANFQLGGATGSTNENTVTVDFSALDSFTASLGAGTFRLGDNNSASGTAAPATMKLASASASSTNTITAALVRIGDGTGDSTLPAGTHVLTLGKGSNVINANTVNVGSAGTTIRSSGAVVFDALDATGSFKLRASDSTGRAILNMVNTSGSTAGDIESTIDLSGHTADVLVSTLTMATRSANTGHASAVLAFNQGTLDVTTLNMASRTSTGTGDATATVNLGDSAAPGSPTTTIGTLNMAVNTSSGGTVSADFNVTGGNVNIGTGSGTAINLANAGTGRTVTSNVNLTGGAVTVTGNIVRTGGAGTENETLTLNGSTLDMSDNAIGSGGTDVNFAAESGTLTNLAELNGGGLLTKTTTGTLTLTNGNTYTGGTTIAAGTLLAMNTTGSATGTGNITVQTTGTLGGTGSVAGNVQVDSGGTLAPGASAGQLTVAGTLNIDAGSTLLAELGGATYNDAATIFTYFNANGHSLTGLTVTPDYENYQVGVTQHDNLNVTGGSVPVINGSFTLGPVLNSYVPVYGDIFDFLDWTAVGSITGATTFDFTAVTLSAGLGFNTDLFASHGLVVVVPEPSRALFLMFGLLGLMLRHRRR